MKRFIRLFILFLLCITLAGVTTSCSIFEKSHPASTKPFKNKKSLPKKWVAHNKPTRLTK